MFMTKDPEIIPGNTHLKAKDPEIISGNILSQGNGSMKSYQARSVLIE